MLRLVQILNLAPGASVYQSVNFWDAYSRFDDEWKLVANLEKVVVVRDKEGVILRLDKAKFPLAHWRV